MASDFTDTEQILKILKTLPRKPQEEKTEDGRRTIFTSINIAWIYEEKQEVFKVIDDWLKKENVSVAWDGKHGIDTGDFEFTYLLEKNENNI